MPAFAAIDGGATGPCAFGVPPVANIPCCGPLDNIIPPDPDDAPPPPALRIRADGCMAKFTSYAMFWQVPQCAPKSDGPGFEISGRLLHCALMMLTGPTVPT